MNTQRFIAWLKDKPATKAAWFAGIVAFLALLLNSLVLYQNSQMLLTSKEALLLSMHPSLELQFYSDRAFLTNTSTQAVRDVRIYPIIYRFDYKPFRVLERNQPAGSSLVTDTLLAQQRILVPNSLLLSIVEDRFNPALSDSRVLRVAVITFRRSTDLRKFASLEIFFADSIKGSLALFGLYSGRNSAVGGPPDRFLKIIDEIEKTEKVFFKVSSFE